jgi:hypothetical protein
MCIKHKYCEVITISPFNQLHEGERSEEGIPARTDRDFKKLIASSETLKASANAMSGQKAASVQIP